MHTTAAARKQVGRFIPSAGPRHRPRPCELLGLKCRDVQSVLDVISSGLRWSSVTSFLRDTGFTQAELAEYLGLRPRALATRKERGKLGEHESERMLRLAEIYEAAFHLFDSNKVDAREWLLSAVRGLNNKRPIDYIRTDFGAREVRSLIGRLERGVFS
jgi:putative toxin-antitoxin system antitoxin component (TIGR02293 family)